MDEINKKYQEVCQRPSDIYEHLPTLYELAKKCRVVAEMGVREVVSTWALLKGLCDSELDTKRTSASSLYCVDIEDVPGINRVIDIASQAGVDVLFMKEDSAKVQFPRSVDMLFIDTWHVYGHLKRELEHHQKNVKRYIVMHDTTIDGVDGESVRCGLNVEKQAHASGYPVDEIKKGLKPAINEFLALHPEWSVMKVYDNNNGLTILRRVS